MYPPSASHRREKLVRRLQFDTATRHLPTARPAVALHSTLHAGACATPVGFGNRVSAEAANELALQQDHLSGAKTYTRQLSRG